MKSAWTAVLVVLFACQPAADETATDAEGVAPAAEAAVEPIRFEGTAYGDSLTLTTLTQISEIKTHGQHMVGQRVLVSGVVNEVCKTKGCWLDLTTDSDTIQVKVEDDVIIFPQTAIGKRALVEGLVEELQLSEAEAVEAAKHRAEELGQPFDRASVTGPVTVFRIRGLGAVIAP